MCLLDREPWPDDGWCAALAAELNLSETAFVRADADGFALRWFTPVVEVDLCGHATLAAAHVLWETGRVDEGDAIRFDTRGGDLGARRDGHDVTLDFPALAATPIPTPAGLEAALGVDVRACATTEHQLLVEVAAAATVAALAPDLAQIAALPVRGVCVTAAAGAGDVDFVSRLFAPRVGIPEDPVTGSAHCALGPWWGPRLGKTALVGRQLSRRGGTVRVGLAGDRVRLGGSAVTVWEGRVARRVSAGIRTRLRRATPTTSGGRAASRRGR